MAGLVQISLEVALPINCSVPTPIPCSAVCPELDEMGWPVGISWLVTITGASGDCSDPCTNVDSPVYPTPCDNWNGSFTFGFVSGNGDCVWMLPTEVSDNFCLPTSGIGIFSAQLRYSMDTNTWILGFDGNTIDNSPYVFTCPLADFNCTGVSIFTYSGDPTNSCCNPQDWFVTVQLG